MDTTMMRMCDNPMPVSLEALADYDKDPPGTWISQKKCDGWRRTIWKLDGQWHYNAKHSTGPHSRPMPPVITEELAAQFSDEDNFALDCEWCGPRQAGAPHRLYLFDLLMHNGDWLGPLSFKDRYQMLTQLWKGRESAIISVLPCWSNPGLVDRFVQQMCDEESEGLVVRRADSGLMGGINACMENPRWLKIKFVRDAR